MLPGKYDQFDVIVDGWVVFSRKEQGGFPDPSQVLDAMREIGAM